MATVANGESRRGRDQKFLLFALTGCAFGLNWALPEPLCSAPGYLSEELTVYLDTRQIRTGLNGQR